MDTENKTQNSELRTQKPEAKTTIFYITDNALKLAERLNGIYPDAKISKFKSEVIPRIWNECRNLIFIMAAGIVVRTIAPLIKDKKTDPAVVVLDEKGEFAISLLSGHVGGANQLASDIANFLGGQAVITSAQLYLRPKNLIIGIGCNSSTSADEIEDSVKTVLNENNLSLFSVHSIATIDIKGSEPGLIAFAKKYNLKIKTFTADELNSAISHQRSAISFSEAVFKATGANAVAEPAAILASESGKLLVKKQKMGNVTIAIAECGMRNAECGMRNLNPKSEIRNPKSEISPKLYIVGTGPGGIAHITPYAQNAIRKSDVIVGYSTYLDLIQELIKDKEIFSTGMTQEIDRCKKAVELAIQGKTVSVISGGDPGIYAMAGLVFEILKSRNWEVGNKKWKIENNQSKTLTSQFLLPTSHFSIEVIPGVSALNACASRLGAPLMHDFVVISLSDRLTPWELIEKRLEAASIADFVIVLYNPKSKGRAEHINKARDIILKHRSPETPVGIVKAAMRGDERVITTNLKNVLDYDIDMQTTVIIGNSQTFVWNGWMITPRGYERR